MGARVGEEIQLLRAVMHGMVVPQPRTFMAETMAPVSADFADKQAQQQRGPQGQGAQGGGHGIRQETLAGDGNQGQRHGQQRGRQQAADEIEALVTEQFRARAPAWRSPQ